MGSKKHGEMGHVDKKLGIFMIITAVIGIRIAVYISTMLFETGEKGKPTGAAADLYISLVFVSILSIVGVSMLKDALSGSDDTGGGPSRRIADALAKMKLSPTIYFPVADVHVSLWVLMIVGLATGYLAGTIGVGGFIGVPAMIYVFGIPAQVAAGTELFLAMFMGAFGALNYAYEGFVDFRLVFLLYGGSLLGIYIGAYGTKVVKEVAIRLATAIIIILCCLSRAIAIPIYLNKLGYAHFDPSYEIYFNQASKALLYASGIAGVGYILFEVIRAWRRQRALRSALDTGA